MPVWRTLLASCLGLCALLPAIVHAETALAALDLPRPTPPPAHELDCLALNIYWEARSESLLGRIAVAAVTLNRVAAPAFPDKVCDVVFQGEELGRNLCQFSWRCDGRTDRPRNLVAWEEARRVARLALAHAVDDPTGGALWYHADHVLPGWAQQMTLRARIGHHLFYGLDPADGVLARIDQAKNDRRPLATREEGPPPIRAALVLPSPMKPALPAWPTAANPEAGALMAALAELKIDFAPDAANGLLLCGVETLCGALDPHPQPERDASAVLPVFDAKRVPGAVPNRSAEISDATHTPSEATVDPVS